MFVRLFVVGLCFAFQRFGAKADMHTTLMDMTVSRMDPDYFDPRKTECSVTPDSSGVNGLNCALALTKTLPSDADVTFKIVGLSMGEYTLPTGVELHMELCEVTNEPIILAPFIFTLFPTKVCPPEPNIYITEGYTVPMHMLPDDFDENSYKVIFELKRKKNIILRTETIVELEY